MRPLTANETQETTLTAGTGTVTLTQQAGWFRFSDKFAVGDRVYYSIRNGSNWENGFGTVGALHTLARTAVQDTLVAGTAGSGSAITLVGQSTVRAVINTQLFGFVLKSEPVLVATSVPTTDGCAYGITASAVILFLNSTPIFGDRIHVFQGAAGITGCQIDPSGGKINGTSGVMDIDIDDFSFDLFYENSSYGWKIDK